MSSYNRRPGERPPQRRAPKRSPIGLICVIALAIALVVAGVLLLPKLTNRGAAPEPSPTLAPEETAAPMSLSDIGAMINDDFSAITPLDESNRVRVSADELSVTSGLNNDWRNILLLGSDGHTDIEAARTDAMIICSINTKTGQVKLCSIMRDMAIEIPGRGEYKMNSANFWGGPWLTVKLINEHFNMNIEDYVMVNFFGFQQVAEYLGGIEMDITEAERDNINSNVSEQIRLGRLAGIDESSLPKVWLEEYGEDVHLDGRQTLAYARIRKLSGEDFERTNRQRKVIVTLLNKMKGTTPIELTRIAANLFGYFSTSMPLSEVLEIANLVLAANFDDVPVKYLPTLGTFVGETRNGDYKMYDVDYLSNANTLYSFIYD